MRRPAVLLPSFVALLICASPRAQDAPAAGVVDTSFHVPLKRPVLVTGTKTGYVMIQLTTDPKSFTAALPDFTKARKSFKLILK